MSTKLAARVGLGALVLFFGATLALSAPPDGKGKGKGGGEDAPAAGALYGDLYVIERDGQGVPITKSLTYEDPETGGNVTVDCLQPAAFPSLTCPSTLLDQCALIPLNGEKTDFDPEVEDACGVQVDYAGCVQEVSFGRMSVSRAPASVIDKSYAEALKALNSAAPSCDLEDQAIAKDAAGRLTLCVPQEDDGTYAWKTIDAPLENLGLYRSLMADGCLGKVTEEKVGEEGVSRVSTYVVDPSGISHLRSSGLGHLICDYVGEPGTWLPYEEEAGCTVTPDPAGEPPDEPCWWETPTTPDRTAPGYEPGAGVTRNDMLSATVFVAGAADKTSPITLDEIVNVNTYIGINLWTYERVKKVTTLTVQYFPFTVETGPGGWFDYGRGQDACHPDTEAHLLQVSNGGFEAAILRLFDPVEDDGVDLDSVEITVCREGDSMEFVCKNGGPVYGPGNTRGCGGADWFAQAAEDARKTIWYLHNWSVPEIAY